MESGNIRTWRNLKVKFLPSPQGNKAQESVSQCNKVLIGLKLEPTFLDSKTSVPVIMPEWPDLVISLQKGNRPGFVFQQKRTLVYRH